MPRILSAVVAGLAVAPVAMGHTWIEQLRNVNDKGQYVGEYGYPRGMVSKTDPGFSGTSMNFEIPAGQGGKVFIDDSIFLCHPDQRKQQQSKDNYPRLKATPGGFIAMRYMENGHVTKPNNQKGKPEKGGTIFVYGTTEPKEDEKIVNVLQWTQDGKGGDGRGTLLAMNNFDDGRCFEVNETPLSQERKQATPNFALGQVSDGPGNYPLFCETNVQLPKNTSMSKPLTLYWVWQWPTKAGNVDPSYPNGKDEYYSTCIDVDVASAEAALAASAEKKFDLGPQQDAMSVAVRDFASRTAIMTDAIKGEVGSYFSSGKQTPAPSATNGAPAPSSAAPAPSSQASAQSSKAPAPSSETPLPSSKASGQPAIPTISRRPGAAPSGKPDTVYVTVTGAPAVQSSPPAVVTSKRAVSSAKSPSGITTRTSQTPRQSAQPSQVSQAPSSAVPSGKLPGFNMGNPHGAKFKRMLKQ
ncbi:hypothetical protein EK21DRAFT_101119 [Setomelanomma holmii]|uniref:DUF7492 domain-containing protein n=1 Tax=Setomelanomma holmii TaxID=210430 RepID=A0A9P4H8J9_9PLEO|nr:hypothetical protein EK21DRAFT_101119 [Setomelanomma holmii]